MSTKKQTGTKGVTPPKMNDESNVGAGVFSNIVNLSMTPREVFLDFGLGVPDSPSGKSKVNLMSRLILTKEHALELRDVLNRSLKVYEK